MQTGSSSKYILAYDANCGSCTKFRRIVDILDKYERIDFISLTKADQEGLLTKFLSINVTNHFSKGDTKSGSEALLELIAILPGGKILSPIINYFPGGKKAVQFIYKRFSRLHDRGSCSINETKCIMISNRVLHHFGGAVIILCALANSNTPSNDLIHHITSYGILCL